MGSLVGSIVPIKPRAVKKAWNLLDHKCNVFPSIDFGTRMPVCDMNWDIPVWLRWPCSACCTCALGCSRVRLAPPLDGLFRQCHTCFRSRYLGFQLGIRLKSQGFHLCSHLLQMLPEQLTLSRRNRTPSAVPARATISCLRIGCRRMQTRCLRRAPRCRRVGKSGNVRRTFLSGALT